ncbi:hypothetical protein BJX65DRAFT_262829 [Aspergillus insuetus]
MARAAIWRRLVAIGLLASEITAQICPGIGYPGVASQDDLDTIAHSCTTIDGDFYISHNYTGSFVLSNVTNITGQLKGTDYKYGRALQLTSFELPDLQHVSSLSVRFVPSLEKWSLPQLAYTNELYVTIPSKLENLEFPALTELGTTQIRGNLSSISFDSLKIVRFRLSIGNRYSVDDITLQTRTSMNISLPALENITAFNVYGRVSRIDVPELAYVPFESVLMMSESLEFDLVDDHQISLDIPKLHHLDGGLKVRGGVTSISLPSLRKIPTGTWDTENHGANQLQGWIEIYPSANLSLDLPIESLYSLSLIGNVSSVHLPNLQNWDWLSVESFIPFNCSTFESQFNATKAQLNGDEIDRNVVCTSFPAPQNSASGVYVWGFASMVVLVIAVLGASVAF